ncbi:hypothetical protein [Calidithermus chliarophilus]|uniref:hypothetical protein n=1 Tax=Calidithermus chliarophilus TaxID=52023 RepID=UPI0012F68E24|nr:hypothetical protein [Calidithermus chliarophilus]
MEEVRPETSIRIVDLFEAVMERPGMYTLEGTYQEAIAFLEGWEAGFVKGHAELEGNFYFREVKRYQLFKAWLAVKLGVDEKEALRSLGGQGTGSTKFALEMYREFKAGL